MWEWIHKCFRSQSELSTWKVYGKRTLVTDKKLRYWLRICRLTTRWYPLNISRLCVLLFAASVIITAQQRK